MANIQRIRKAVQYVDTDELPAFRTQVNTNPLYDVKAKLMSCDSYDDARAVIRQATPVNVVKATTGLFVTEISDSVTYEPIELKTADYFTFDGDKIVVTESAEFIGMTDKAIYVTDKNNRIRQLKRDITFIVIGN